MRDSHEYVRKGGAAVTTCASVRWPNERAAFVKAEVRRLGGKLTPGTDAVLVEAVGSDLRELASAVAQLVADTGGTVDDSAVHRYHRGRAEVFGWDISDLAVAGDRAGALEAVDADDLQPFVLAIRRDRARRRGRLADDLDHVALADAERRHERARHVRKPAPAVFWTGIGDLQAADRRLGIGHIGNPHGQRKNVKRGR